MKITICDITIRERVVELPKKCPNCDVELDKTVLTGWEYQDQSRQLSEHEDGMLDYYDRDNEIDLTPESGEGFISYVALVCQCGHFFVEGKIHREKAPKKSKSKKAKTRAK